MVTADDDAPAPLEDPRPGEVVSPGRLAIDAGLTFIGTIATPWTRTADCPRQGDRDAGPICRLAIAPRWHAAMEGIETLDDLQVLYWLHAARRDLVRLAPRNGMLRGPFALRAPTRPNPIGSATVRRVASGPGYLDVRGLDCLDGTPLLDVKRV